MNFKFYLITLIILLVEINAACQNNAFAFGIGVSGGSDTKPSTMYSFNYSRVLIKPIKVSAQYLKIDANQKFNDVVFDETKNNFFNSSYISLENNSLNPIVDFTNLDIYSIMLSYSIYNKEKGELVLSLGASKIFRSKIKPIETGSLLELYFYNTSSENLLSSIAAIEFKRKIFKNCKFSIECIFVPKIEQIGSKFGLEFQF